MTDHPAQQDSTAGVTSRRDARRREVSKGDRREHALLDALEGLLGEVSWERISVDRITERGEVGRTAFYFYFRSKEAALQALIERSLASIWETGGDWLFGEGEPREALGRAVEGLVAAWDAHAALLGAVVEAASYDPGIRFFWQSELEGFIDAVEARIERDVASGHGCRGLDPRGTAEALCWMNERCCYVYLSPGGDRRRPEEVAGKLFAIWRSTLYGPGS